jgi:hypothetical protein
METLKSIIDMRWMVLEIDSQKDEGAGIEIYQMHV